MDSLRAIGRALRINGLPGFSDVVRTYRIDNPKKLVAATTLAGAALGALEGDEAGDILKGAVGGAAIGLGARAFAKGAYGYLPDRLVRLNTALRYTLSATFDAGRYSEQNMIAMAKYGLPGFLRPEKYIAARGVLKSPFSNGTVHGQETWDHALRYFDNLNGTRYFQSIDDRPTDGSGRFARLCAPELRGRAGLPPVSARLVR